MSITGELMKAHKTMRDRRHRLELLSHDVEQFDYGDTDQIRHALQGIIEIVQEINEES